MTGEFLESLHKGKIIRTVSYIKLPRMLVGIGIFILAMFISLNHYPPNSWVPYDGALYIDIANTLSKDPLNFSYQGIYMLFRPPIYPYTLSIVYRLIPSRNPVTITRLVTSIFYAGTAVLIFILFGRYAGYPKGGYASILYILNPIALGMSTQPLVHSQFTFFYLISMYYLLKWSENLSKSPMVLFGISAGISTLTRYTGLSILLITIVYVYLLYLSNNIKENNTNIIAHLVVGMGVFFVILTPWMIMGAKYYTGPMSPFTVASREVNTAAARVPSFEYILNLTRTLGIVGVTLTVIGILYSLSKRDKPHILMVSWFFIGFMSILTIIHKEVRFITFLTPVIAMLNAEGVCIISKTILSHRFISKKSFRIFGTISMIVLLALSSISYYENAIKYNSKYYYAGSSQAKVLNELNKIIPKAKTVSILVSPNLYPYAGLFIHHAEVYQMSSYDINWLGHGLSEKQPPNVSKMITTGYFDYVVYCRFPHISTWTNTIDQTHMYKPVAGIFNKRCWILQRNTYPIRSTEINKKSFNKTKSL